MKVFTKAADVDSEGVWAKYPGSSAEFLIARAGNSRFLAAMDRAERPFRKQRNRGALSTEKEIELQCRGMAEGILLSWRGLRDEEGNDFPYSGDNAFAVLRHNTDIREFVTDFATDVNNFRQEDIDATSKK